MAVIVNQEKCIGCSACVPACPFSAIDMVNGKAQINEKCTLCGACVPVCPVEAIFREEIERTVTMDKSEFSGVWVFIEQADGHTKGVGHELLGEGRKLADELGQKLAGVLIGNNVEHMAKDVFASGADIVYLVEGPEYDHYNTDAYTIAFVDVINKYKPSAILVGATNDGRDLAPRIAARVRTGLCADCTGFPSTPKPSSSSGPDRLSAGTSWLTFFVPSIAPRWVPYGRRCSNARYRTRTGPANWSKFLVRRKRRICG